MRKKKRKKKIECFIKYDCFAYKKRLESSDSTGKCIALDKLYCKTEKCSFYKTEEEFKRGAEKYPNIMRCHLGNAFFI